MVHIMSEHNLDLPNQLITSLVLSDEFAGLCATKMHLHEEIHTWAGRVQRETTAAFQILKADFDTWRTHRNDQVDPYELLYITPMLKFVNDGGTSYHYYTWGRLVNSNYIKRSGKKGEWNVREIFKRGKEFTKNDFKRSLNTANEDCLDKMLEAEHALRFLRRQNDLVIKMRSVSHALRPKHEFQALLGKAGVNDCTEVDLERLNKLQSKLLSGEHSTDPLGLPKTKSLVRFAEQNAKPLVDDF